MVDLACAGAHPHLLSEGEVQATIVISASVEITSCSFPMAMGQVAHCPHHQGAGGRGGQHGTRPPPPRQAQGAHDQEGGGEWGTGAGAEDAVHHPLLSPSVHPPFVNTCFRITPCSRLQQAYTPSHRLSPCSCRMVSNQLHLASQRRSPSVRHPSQLSCPCPDPFPVVWATCLTSCA